MLTNVQKEKIEEIRESVATMIAQRDSGDIADVFGPSDFWLFVNNYLAYIRTLSAEHLENIRCHVGMGYFLGPAWDTEFYQGFRAKNDTEAATFPLVRKYINFTSGLPERFWASEPSTNEATAALGIRYRGRLVNADVVKEQATIRNLFNLGLIRATGDNHLTVLEIGPGYGQLVFQLSKMLGSESFFACVDCPETLFWSGVYLAVNSDPSGIYVWKPGAKETMADLRRNYRFALLPNFALSMLGEERMFDLAINKNSFQEMSEAQVSFYAKAIAKILKGWIFSYNAARQFMNKELRTHVHDLLGEHFIGGPTDEEYKQAGVEFEDSHAKRIFVGYSKSISHPPSRQNHDDVVWLSDKAVRVAPFSRSVS